MFHAYLYSPRRDRGFSLFSPVLIHREHPYRSFQVIDKVQRTTCVILRTQTSYTFLRCSGESTPGSTVEISHYRIFSRLEPYLYMYTLIVASKLLMRSNVPLVCKKVSSSGKQLCWTEDCLEYSSRSLRKLKTRCCRHVKTFLIIFLQNIINASSNQSPLRWVTTFHL